MWSAPITILDDEDEAELLNRFVELSVAYPDHSVFEVAQEVFRDKPDSALRANQAALYWGNQLAIKERIRKGRLGDSSEVETYTKTSWLAEVLATSRDENMTATAKKAKLEGLKLYGDGQGWVSKPAEAPKADDGRRKSHPQFVFAQYADD